MSQPITTDNLPPALTKADVARVLNRSERTVERLIRARVLPDPFIPGRWSRDVVLSWIANGGARRVGR